MLPTTAQFDAAADAGTTEADARVRIYREFNAIAPTITVSAVHDPVDSRFDESAVVNIRNPKRNGISYGPMREFFTSNNPNKGFRLILGRNFDLDTNARYYIPKLSANNTSADLTVDYTVNYEMNQIIVRYENTRNSSTYYNETIKVYITPSGGSETLVFTGTMNDTGETLINYDGATWDEGQSFAEETVATRKVRVVFTKGTWKHQPRIMYVGGVHALDVSDDIISVSVDKSEFERDALMPIGQPSANTCDIQLDNTNLRYRFSSGADENFFLKHQQVEIEFGLNIKYGGGADTFEYVKGGTFYIDSYGYSESDLKVSISGRDYASVLQERFCGNYLWENKSLKHIVYDMLARSGVALNSVIFDFGIAANADESNKRNYVWSHESQTVWDFLTDLAKSELGTVFFDEEENLVFTDRLDIDTKFLDGSQYTIREDINLESIEEDFEVVANKVKVGWEELNLNSTTFKPETVIDATGELTYAEGPPELLNQILWQPNSEESYLGSATLYKNLGTDDTYIYLTKESAIQITRDEGEVLIGQEFIRYKDRTVLGNGLGRLRITERNVRDTVAAPQKHLGVHTDYGLSTGTRWSRSVFPSGIPTSAVRKNTADGFLTALRSRSSKYTQAIYANIYNKKAVNSNTKYETYHCRFRFNDQGGTWREDDAGGMFIGLNRSGYAIYFEVSNPKNKAFVNSGGANIGNARAYKASPYMTIVPMPPYGSDDSYGTDFLYEKASGNNDGTYIDITVVQESGRGADRITWYVNGELIDSFYTSYSSSALKKYGYNKHQVTVGTSGNETGPFGTFTRGSTSMTVDFLYASNDQSLRPDVLADKGFSKYYDAGRNSHNVKNVASRIGGTISDAEYYVEFGSPVHEVVEYKVEHDSYPSATANILNTAEDSVTVIAANHTPFSSYLLLANSSRVGVNLNDTVFYQNGTKLDHSFFVYGVSVIRSDREEISTSDGPSIRRYGIEEVELDNPWVNSRRHAVSLANYIRKFWSDGQQHFTADVFPNPAIQPRDRVSLSYPAKGLTGGDTWFVNGVSIRYDGGLSCTLKLKRFIDYPDVNDNIDYRDDGGINIT